MKISKGIFRQTTVDDEKHQVGSKKHALSLSKGLSCPEASRRACPEVARREGRSRFCAWSLLVRREHGKMARTLLTDFFNSPIKNVELRRKGEIRNRDRALKGIALTEADIAPLVKFLQCLNKAYS